ncbi:MAG: type II toxin-antitoxin system HicB family antitoxin, partial [Nitrospiraceae bacterium]
MIQGDSLPRNHSEHLNTPCCRATIHLVHAYTAVIEQCPDTALYVGHVPGFPGAHSQAATLDELHASLREVI